LHFAYHLWMGPAEQMGLKLFVNGMEMETIVENRINLYKDILLETTMTRVFNWATIKGGKGIKGAVVD